MRAARAIREYQVQIGPSRSHLEALSSLNRLPRGQAGNQLSRHGDRAPRTMGLCRTEPKAGHLLSHVVGYSVVPHTMDVLNDAHLAPLQVQIPPAQR
jgi:hypothetical protein